MTNGVKSEKNVTSDWLEPVTNSNTRQFHENLVTHFNAMHATWPFTYYVRFLGNFRILENL